MTVAPFSGGVRVLQYAVVLSQGPHSIPLIGVRAGDSTYIFNYCRRGWWHGRRNGDIGGESGYSKMKKTNVTSGVAGRHGQSYPPNAHTTAAEHGEHVLPKTTVDGAQLSCSSTSTRAQGREEKTKQHREKVQASAPNAGCTHSIISCVK